MALALYIVMLSRSDTLSLIHASLHAQRPDYARRLANNWLHTWPGDTGVQFLLARSHIADNQAETALGLLEQLVTIDPEHFPAHDVMASVYEMRGDSQQATIATGIARLPTNGNLPRLPWIVASRESWIAIRQKRWDAARAAAERALHSDPPSALPSLLMLKSLWLADQIHLAFPLAQAFYDRWPNCVAVNLCLAESLLQTGDYTRGVNLLHNVVSLDPSAEITNRYWDHNHPYRPIWPPEPQVPAPGPTPPEVSAQLGTNRLGNTNDGFVSTNEDITYEKREAVTEIHINPAPTPGSEQPTLAPADNIPESLRDIEAELDNVRNQINHWSGETRTGDAASNRLHPIYVVLTSKVRLEKQFGSRGAERVLMLLRLLVQTVSQTTQRSGIIIIPEEADSLRPYKIDPVDPNDPWEIKTMLHRLNSYLAQDSRTIGSLLLVGGDDVVPFHRLPNPTDDHDHDVPSDNPYGTSDHNYFVPEWPVGRLATHSGNDLGPLINLIQRTIRAYGSPAPKMNFLLRWLSWIFPKWHALRNGNRSTSRGFTADIWKDASLEVFSPIGHPRDLHASPPLQVPDLPGKTLSPTDLCYFNLHGLEDSPDWYGQSANLSGNGSSFPIALRPGDILNNGRAAKVVFTEACYGANILDKHDPESAICLRFLSAGTHAVIGATRVAYGSVGTPLVGADLLGRYFWDSVLAGIPVGEALRRAKLGFAHSMHESQGFLDSEDQKTLISFVLYGDPLLVAPNLIPSVRQPMPKSIESPNAEVHPTCAKAHCTVDELGNHEIMEHVKTLVSQYMPGMEQCDVRIGQPRSTCDGHGHDCPTSHMTMKSASPNAGQLVYTLSQEVHVNNHRKHQYAHVTVNKSGKVLKMAVSK